MKFVEQIFSAKDVLQQGNLFAEKCKDADMRDVLSGDVLMYCFKTNFAGNGGQLMQAMRTALKTEHGINADGLCEFELVATYVAREDKAYAKHIYTNMLQVAEMQANKQTKKGGKNAK